MNSFASKSLVAGAAVAVAAALVVPIAGPANAKSVSIGDRSKDAVVYGGARHGVADIKKLRLTHSKSTFTAVVKFKNLTKTNWSTIYVGSQSNDNSSYSDIAMSVRRDGGPYSKKVYLAGDGAMAPHCNAKVQLKYGKGGWARLSAPRHCFVDSQGNMPKRIRSYSSVYNSYDADKSGAYDFAPNGFGRWVKRG
ncbi:MAG: hypothetical protein WC054_06130 [Candidatus Nanopelagicales bacterium]